MTDQPLTDVPGTESVPNASGQDIDFRIESDGLPMKQVYKFFQIAILNEREELQFNKDFEGWAVAGMATHGARVAILGTKWVPAVEDVEEVLVEEEKTPVGALGLDVDEKDASEEPVRKKPKVVDPFRKGGAS